MDLSGYAYPGKRAVPRVPNKRRANPKHNGRWSVLDNDALAEVFAGFDDRELARVSGVDRRTLRVARPMIRRFLGLSESQWDVFDAVVHRRENVLLMGAPGTGKSFLLNVLVERVPRAMVTASSAAAADKLSGASTLHSALGIGFGQSPAEKVVARLAGFECRGRDSTMACIKATKTLIVDEVSMLSGKTLSLVEEVLKLARGGAKRMPQLVFSGDPMQLAAVDAKENGPFYTTGVVQRLRPYVLTEPFRQTEDSPFLRILNSARMGKAREADVDWLRAHFSPSVRADAPKLFCHLKAVANHNLEELRRLSPPEFSYVSSSKGLPPGVGTIPATLVLRLGARVLLNRNVPEHIGKLHNGSCGTVTQLANDTARVRFDCGVEVTIKKYVQEYKDKEDKVAGTRTFMPLTLAWAVSIHRAQGATLDAMRVDLKNCFEPGQAYVALSRVREAHHAQVDNLSLNKLIWVDKEALRFYSACAARSEARAERRRERERRAERKAHEVVDDDALNAMMDAVEAAAC